MKLIFVNNVLDGKDNFKITNDYLECDWKDWFMNGDLIQIVDTKTEKIKEIVVSEKNGANKKKHSFKDRLFGFGKHSYNKVKIEK